MSGCRNVFAHHLIKATAVMIMLESLDISDCVQFDSDNLIKVMSRLPLLVTINISNCSSLSGFIFDRFTEFQNLCSVSSSGNQQMEFESVSRFLGSSSKIKRLCLSRSHIFKCGLMDMALCKSLDSLDVSSCGLTIVSSWLMFAILCSHMVIRIPLFR